MRSTGEPEPRKGSGYFAKRLKEKGISTEPVTAEKTERESEAPAATKVGQIFEESTKSIATMTDDVSETAKMVSSMKEGLERVTKIADMFSTNPLCDATGSCSFEGVGFAPDMQGEETRGSTMFDAGLPAKMHVDNVDKIVSDSSCEIAGLATDADTIREGLQEFREAISKKESDLLAFRKKLNQVRLQGQGLEVQSCKTTTGLSDESSHDLQQDAPSFSEFDSVTTTDSMDFASVPKDFVAPTIQKEIKDAEGKLLNLRWKIKKIEAEYERKKAQADSLEDLESEVGKLEARRDGLQSQIGKLEEQQKESNRILKETELKIGQAKKESEENGGSQRQVSDTRAILEYLKLDKEGLKVELEQMRTKVKEAERALEEKKAANDALEDVRFTVSTLRAEKVTLEAELEQMRNKVKKVEWEIQEKRLEKEKMGELKSVLTHLKIEKDSLEDELSDLKSKIRKAESEYQQKKQAADELYEVREILAYLKPEREHLKSEISQIRAKIEKLEQHHDEISAKRSKTQSEYDDLELKVRRLKSEYDQKSLSRLS